jgi:hypothetical protein
MGPAVFLRFLDGAHAAIEPDGDDLALVADGGETPEADVPADLHVQLLGGKVAKVRKVLEEHGPVFGELR